VHTFITTHILTSKDTKELRDVFRKIDLDSDGKLSKSELLTHYSLSLGVEQAEEEVERIMRDVDTDNNGFIDYTEFIKASIDSRVVLTKENLRATF